MDTGTIELICGCMFSGKTTELIARLNNLSGNQRVICLKPAIDDRYSATDIVTHDGKRIHAQVVASAHEILEKSKNATVVAIDEIHFFDDSIVDVCRQLVQRGIRVICTGLDRDMWGDEFPHIRRLSQLAHTTFVTAVCKKCGGIANRTQRIIPLLDNNVVGGPEAFEPRCSQCFTPPDAPKPTIHITGLANPATHS